MPVSTWHVVALEDANVESSLFELAIGDQATRRRGRAPSVHGYNEATVGSVPHTSSNNSHFANGVSELVELGLCDARAFIEQGRLLRAACQHRGASEEHEVADLHGRSKSQSLIERLANVLDYKRGSAPLSRASCCALTEEYGASRHFWVCRDAFVMRLQANLVSAGLVLTAI